MNTLKEVKPLIEWENYLGVWMVDLLPEQHFVEYSKMEAFEKIGNSNVRDWSVGDSELYNQLVFNNGILCLENKRYNVIDNRKRPLIEWEKEIGYFIFNFTNSQHLENCTKSEAIKKLYGNYFVRSWDDYADNIYIEYANDLMNSKKLNTEKLIIKDFECVDVKFKNNCEGNSVKKKDSMFKKLSKIKTKLSEKIEEKIIKINNKENKVKVRKSGFKAFISLTLSLVTSVSMYGLSKMKTNCDDSIQNPSFVNEVDGDLVNLNENLLFNNDYRESVIDNKILEDIKGEEIFDKSCDNIKEFVKEKKDTKNVNIKQDASINFRIDDDINLGDKIILEEGSKVYDNVYSAIDKNGGYCTYYSYDAYRKVNYVALNYCDNIIYSNNINEVNDYKLNGAEVVSICTDDGFYNVNDVIKVKSKKLR